MQSKFIILDHEALLDHQNKAIKDVEDLLCVPHNEAARVLRFYKW